MAENTDNPTSAAEQPATIAQLKAEFPEDPKFALEAAEKSLTLTQAKAAFADHLRAQLQNRDAELEAARKETAELKAQTAASQEAGGVEPLGTGSSGKTQVDGEPIAQFRAAVQELVGQGMTAQADNRKVSVEQPELREAYLQAWNDAHPRQRPGRD